MLTLFWSSSSFAASSIICITGPGLCGDGAPADAMVTCEVFRSGNNIWDPWTSAVQRGCTVTRISGNTQRCPTLKAGGDRGSPDQLCRDAARSLRNEISARDEAAERTSYQSDLNQCRQLGASDKQAGNPRSPPRTCLGTLAQAYTQSYDAARGPVSEIASGGGGQCLLGGPNGGRERYTCQVTGRRAPCPRCYRICNSQGRYQFQNYDEAACPTDQASRGSGTAGSGVNSGADTVAGDGADSVGGADTSPVTPTVGPYCREIGGTAENCNEADAQQFVQDACRQTVTEARAISATCTLSSQCQERGISAGECTAGSVAAAARRGNSGSGSDAQQQQVAIRQCEVAHDNARRCCEDPVACLTNNALSKNNSQGIEMLAQSVMGQMGNQTNVAQICQSQETLAYTSAAINALSARSCESKRNYCQQQCGNLIRTAEGQAAFTTTAARQTAASTLTQLREFKENCDGFAESTAASTAEVASNVNQVMQARLCRDAVRDQAGTLDFTPPTLDGGSVPNLCDQPGMAGTGLCGGTAGGGAETGDGTTGTASGGGSDTGAYLPDSSVASQDAQYGAGAASAASNGGVPNNGGGFSPNGGNSTGNMGAGGRGGGGGSQGKNTDIMQGFRGGGGYSSSGVGTESRGGGGSGRSGGAGFGAMSLMDLKKLLPGFENSPTRAIAGMGTGARGVSDLGMAHEDIFTKMTRAVTRQCIQARLADCSVNAGKGN